MPENAKWCPVARISIQRISQNGIEVINTGGFNSVCLYDPAHGNAGTDIRPASPCLGNKCAWHRKKLFSDKGECSLKSISAASILMLILFLSIGLLNWILFLWLFMKLF